MDKFGSLFGSSFAPGDGEAQTAELKDYDGMRMDYNGPDVAPPGPGFGGGQLVGGPVMPPSNNEMMPSPAVLPPGFDDSYMPQPSPTPLEPGPGFGGFFRSMQPGIDNIFRSIPGLFGPKTGGPMPQPQPRFQPQPQPMPGRQFGFRPDTRAPGGGGMDFNGNPIGGGMGVQFNFAGPGRGMQQPMPQPMPQNRMPAPMRPSPGPVRPTGSFTRPRIR